MQDRHSWESGREVASRSFIDAGLRIYARVDEVGKKRGLSGSLVFANGLRFIGSDATLVQSRVRLTAPHGQRRRSRRGPNYP